MAHRHVQWPEPRAHWVLLVLGLALLLGVLSLNGYVRHVGADGTGPPAVPPGAPAAAPAGVLRGGPVIRVDPAGGATSRGMPDRVVALTFDDGPDPVWTPRILDVLARHHAHATFFVIGSQVDRYPALTRRIVAEGHELGVHTFTHPGLSAVPAWRRDAELSLTQAAVAGATGRSPTLMRPPYSSTPDALTAADYAVLRDPGVRRYLIVLADHDSEDWRRRGVPSVLSASAPRAPRGAVVMMHDGGGDRSQTVAALQVLLDRLGRQGYTFVTVSSGVGLPAMSPSPLGARLRGTALRWCQRAGGWLALAMTVLLWLTAALALLRAGLQVGTARVRRRRMEARRRRRLMDLGPATAIVPAYNEAANIAATVRSLVASDYPGLEVIVVDDGSGDDTAGIVRRLALPGVRLLRQANAGKPAALNLGIAHARSELLVLVDADTVLQRDAVGRLLQPLRDSTIGAVSGNTKVANRGGLLGRWQHLEYVMGFNLDRRMFEIGECMPTVPGAIGAFRRRAVADVGGVPGDTLAEDTDLTMGILRAGWRVVYEEAAIAWTEAPGSLRQLWRQRYRWCYGTMQAMWKHRTALTEKGPAGRFGRRGLTYLVVLQLLLPLAAPVIDVYLAYGLLFLPWTQVALTWGSFLLLQTLTAGYALRLDRESLRTLWALPLQQLVYRQLMYLVVVQSTVTAVTGTRLRWQRITRTGQARSPVPTG